MDSKGVLSLKNGWKVSVNVDSDFDLNIFITNEDGSNITECEKGDSDGELGLRFTTNHFEEESNMPDGLVIDEYGNKAWYKDGFLHRKDGPAIIYPDGTQLWFYEGDLHRSDGPAIIYPDGTEKWFCYGKPTN